MISTLAIEAHSIFWVTALRLTRVSWRAEAPSALVGASVVLFMAAHDAQIWLATPAFLMLIGAVMVGGLAVRNRRMFAGAALLVGLFTAGGIGADIWGTDHLSMSILIAMMGWMGLLVYCTKLTDRVWAWVTAGAGVHMVVILYQDWLNLADRTYRATGLVANANIAAGLLDVAIIYLLLKGKWWLTPPFIIALLATGSRLGFWVMVGIIAIMVMRKAFRWWGVLVLGAALVITALVLPGGVAHQRALFYGVAPRDYREYMTYEIDLRFREAETVREPTMPGILPTGYTGDRGAHNAFWRIWYYGGILGLAAYSALYLRGMWVQRGTMAWWVLALFLGLGTLDFYVVMPSTVLLWWLALSLQSRQQSQLHIHRKCDTDGT